MVRPKLYTIWPVILAISAFSLVYAIASIELLRPNAADITFTKEEIRGLRELELVIPHFIALYQDNHTVNDLDKKSESLRHNIQEIGDYSNLILDPEIHSYYAVALLVSHLPLLLEQIRNNKNLFLHDIAYHLDKLNHAADQLCSQPYDGCTKLTSVVKDIDDILSSSRPLSGEQKNILLNHMEAMAKITDSVLSNILDDRLTQQTNHHQVMLAIIISLYVLLISLILFSLRNYVNKREVNLANERQRLIRQLGQKNDELEKFAYAAAHDLKEPIRTMRSFATLLKNETQELHGEPKNYVSVIENTAKRAEEMINDLLHYTQVSETKLTAETCDCQKELLAVLQDLAPLIESTNPEITVGDMPTIQTVPSMYRRVMMNLLDNAIKYRSPDRHALIHISAVKQANECLFTVCDNGIGFSNRHAEVVFEPFRRLEPAMYKEGSGIGLTSCRKIVERLGGKIWIEPNQAHGITVYFTLSA